MSKSIKCHFNPNVYKFLKVMKYCWRVLYIVNFKFSLKFQYKLEYTILKLSTLETLYKLLINVYS